MDAHETCGSLYAALWEKIRLDGILEDAPDKDYALFAMGFMAGQAEKVYSGACQACMIRPAAEWMEWAIEALHLVCDHYGLSYIVYTGEIWGYHPKAGAIRQLAYAAINTPEWHSLRAYLCGIPYQQWDME